ncbi:hypothetical protein HYV98_00125 [Candidatus Azambacteria bacterium]|nr:hypothetical protein [Candidatus Azambacteria bacterium]
MAEELSKHEAKHFLGHCHQCNARYSPKQAKVIRRSNGVTYLHVDCAECHASILLAMMVGSMGLVTTIGLPTDLEKGDLERFAFSPTITHDDVLAFHKTLEEEL